MFGGKEEVVGRVVEGIAKLGAGGLNAGSDGVFRTTMVDGETVVVTGQVANRVINIGNFWVDHPPV